ncbi:MAG: DUF3696 domain-containing protein [Deltaproteobacteria bacterium]|nr:DUF3696 domain-containing protein [Deltaproteobacteria bacterium]MBN2672513.1 DUF3696 domain-containing protein [Deltaproteobacteria bacterium]
MLKHLQIRNFKGWKDTGPIRMAPITLFFGANSSGKSSIGQFLMMLKQTVESPDRKAVFYPGGKNSAVQLGTYQEMVFHRDPANKISFEYKWVPALPQKVKDPISGNNFVGDELSFNAEIGKGADGQPSIRVEQLMYHLWDGASESLKVGMTFGADKGANYKAIWDGYDLIRQKGRPWSFKAPIRFYGFPEEMVAYHQNAEFVQDLNLQHEKLFGLLSFLGPLRTKAERLYSWTGIEPESVGYSGENTVAAILAASSRKIGLLKPGARKASPAKPFEEVIALKLLEMNLITDFSVKAIAEERQEYEVKVRTKGSSDWVDLPDVGFGISQVLPVLVQCFYAPPGSIILMEQPEIHLHPSAQSALADVMIDVIKSRENGEDRNIQLIIETHSEHFLRRLQRRIAEGAVSQDDVSAYFANITKTPAQLEPLKIDPFGNIRNWPENFFGDEMADITAQSRAAVKKRMEKAAESPESYK